MELAVALIMALAFAAVVTATVDVIMDLVGKVGVYPRLLKLCAGWFPCGLANGGVVSFVIMAAVVYFLIVMPYTKAKERYFPTEEPGEPARRRAHRDP